MAHDDRFEYSNFLTFNKLTLFYSMLTFSFDCLSVACTCFVELGCDELYIGHTLKRS